MGMPTQPILDMMRRSMANLAFVEAHANPSGPYEVTQLVNTFLGALAHPFEAMRDGLMTLPLREAEASGWPQIKCERATDRQPSSLGDLVRNLRNAFAHGNIDFLSDGKSQISALRLWNTNRQGRRDWGSIVTVTDMRCFLHRFVELIERRHRDFGMYVREAA